MGPIRAPHFTPVAGPMVGCLSRLNVNVFLLSEVSIMASILALKHPAGNEGSPFLRSLQKLSPSFVFFLHCSLEGFG